MYVLLVCVVDSEGIFNVVDKSIKVDFEDILVDIGV